MFEQSIHYFTITQNFFGKTFPFKVTILIQSRISVTNELEPNNLFAIWRVRYIEKILHLKVLNRTPKFVRYIENSLHGESLKRKAIV